MPPLPYSRLGAQIPFFVVMGIWVLLETRVRLRSRLNRRGARLERGSLLVLLALVYAGLFGGFELAGNAQGAAIADGRWPLFVVGIVLMCAGIAIRQWAVALLGELFTIDVRVHKGQSVIERGPYRWVRHPSYTGLILTFVGIGLALGNWAALIVLAVLPTAGLVVRIRFEERALLAGLGEPYRRFAATRPHLFPGLW
ncbi:MAG TPA: isoprenylcysteine carboxylmethyltransferase family protein [Gaiellaceae bacterium]